MQTTQSIKGSPTNAGYADGAGKYQTFSISVRKANRALFRRAQIEARSIGISFSAFVAQLIEARYQKRNADRRLAHLEATMKKLEADMANGHPKKQQPKPKAA